MEEEKQPDVQVIPTLLKLAAKEDMVKLLMGKLDELDHIPPKAYDTIK